MFRIILLSIFLTGCTSMYKSAADLHQYRTDVIGGFIYGEEAPGKPVIGPNGEYLGVVSESQD